MRLTHIKNRNNQCWQGMWQEKNLHSLGNVFWFNLCGKTVWWFLKKLESKFHRIQAILLLGIYPKSFQMLIIKDNYTPLFIAVLFIVDKMWETTWASNNRWLDKEIINARWNTTKVQAMMESCCSLSYGRNKNVLMSKMSQRERDKHRWSFLGLKYKNLE